jgi:hypothetical protein
MSKARSMNSRMRSTSSTPMASCCWLPADRGNAEALFPRLRETAG